MAELIVIKESYKPKYSCQTIYLATATQSPKETRDLRVGLWHPKTAKTCYILAM